LDLAHDRDARLRRTLAGRACVCPGFTLWKRPITRTFLATLGATDCFFPNRRADPAALAAERRGVVIVWASEERPDLAERCQALGVELLRMEDGFVRSKGLGSDFHWPFSFVLDRAGIYYDPTGPSDLEELLETAEINAELRARGACLRQILVERAITKYAAGGTQAPGRTRPSCQRVLLVPGQVETDASVLKGGGAIQTNLALLTAVREANPDAWIIYKPHPDVARGNRAGDIDPARLRRLADEVATDLDIARLFEQVDEVHTLTSLAGFEALLRGVMVHVHGRPFYAGWGLTHDHQPCPRRTRILSLDELVAASLILYPRYYDWRQARLAEVENVLDRLAGADALSWSMRWRSRVFFGARETLKALHLVPLIRWLNR
jgi:capsular polysaccharide export protein